jgi:hypothetical protein
MNAERHMSFTLRDVEDSDLELLLQLNEMAVPAVSRVDLVGSPNTVPISGSPHMKV